MQVIIVKTQDKHFKSDNGSTLSTNLLTLSYISWSTSTLLRPRKSTRSWGLWYI